MRHMVERWSGGGGGGGAGRGNAHSERTTIIVTTKQNFIYNVTFKHGIVSCLVGLKTNKQKPTNKQTNGSPLSCFQRIH